MILMEDHQKCFHHQEMTLELILLGLEHHKEEEIVEEEKKDKKLIVLIKKITQFQIQMHLQFMRILIVKQKINYGPKINVLKN